MNELAEHTIHESVDEYGELHVKEEGLLRSLYFGNDKKQSCVFLPDPTILILQYTQAMTAALLFQAKPKKILLIGLGGGSMLMYLSKVCLESKIDVLELRERVIQLSHDFFQVPETMNKVNIIHVDAVDYVMKKAKKNSQVYDLILIDAFDAWGPASLNKDQNFIVACQSLIKNDGVIGFNLWNRKKDNYDFMSRHLSLLFSGKTLELVLGKCDSNVVVFGFSDAEKLKNISEYHKLAIELTEKYGIDYVRFLKMFEVQNYSLLKRIKNKLKI